MDERLRFQIPPAWCGLTGRQCSGNASKKLRENFFFAKFIIIVIFLTLQ